MTKKTSNRNQVTSTEWNLIASKFAKVTKQKKDNITWELLYNDRSRHVASYNPKLKRLYTDGGNDILKIVDDILAR